MALNRQEPIDRPAVKEALDRIFYLFLEKPPEEIKRALKREELLFRYQHMLGRKSFMALVDELSPSLGAERLYDYIREIEEERERRRKERS